MNKGKGGMLVSVLLFLTYRTHYIHYVHVMMREKMRSNVGKITHVSGTFHGTSIDIMMVTTVDHSLYAHIAMLHGR